MDKISLKNKLRNKKIGILLIDARRNLRYTEEECAQALGLSVSEYSLIESGERALSLPEMEIISFYLKLPLEHFWKQELMGDSPRVETIQEKKRFLTIRNKILSTNLKLARGQKNLSIAELSSRSGIGEEQLRTYESGEVAIPISDLETITEAMEIRIDKLFDQFSPVGKRRIERINLQKFQELPQDLQEFVLKPVNQPYVKLAVRLSALSAEKLRAVAESLLEITY